MSKDRVKADLTDSKSLAQSVTTSPKTMRMEFLIDTKDVLNSNSMPSQWFLKSKMSKNLRELGRQVGLKAHSNPEFANQMLEHAKTLKNTNTIKARTHKQMRKAGKSEEQIEKAVLEAEKDYPVKPKPEGDFFEFNEFTVNVLVCPPTKRRIDPPNLYPTVKNLLDGCVTDVGIAPDDDFKHIKRFSFEYGGLSGEKGKYRIILEFEEVA